MATGTVSFGPFAFDRANRTLTRNGTPVPVGQRGLVLLETLLDAEGEAVSKEHLMSRAWPGAAIEEGNLTVQISNLRRQLGAGAEAMIVTVPRIGYRFVAQPSPRQAPERTGAPLIAVMPFADHGSVGGDGHFAGGLVEGVVTALSRFKSFAVVSAATTFPLRETGAGARSASAALGVRYALVGSVRRMGDQLRVSAQLLDAATGAQLWGDRYDGATADSFAFQDRVTESIAGVLEPEIRKAEIERVRRKAPAELDAYELYLKAFPVMNGPDPEHDPEAMALLERAIALDPGFAMAYAAAALIHEKRLSLRVPPLGGGDPRTPVDLTRQALALGSDDPRLRAICALLLFRFTQDRAMLDVVRQTVSENPYDTIILTCAAGVVGLHGCLEESIGYHTRAYALSPTSPEAYQNLQGLGSTHFLLGNYERAIEWAQKSLGTFNDLIFNHVCLACAYAALGRRDEALAAVRRILEVNPALTIKGIEDGNNPEDSFGLAIIPWLRQLGLPEQ